ncbi:VWA domain-containing protein [Myxococcota bacterium]|nr:VWA domain-containing protein [Myxococcota bacterium]
MGVLARFRFTLKWLWPRALAFVLIEGLLAYLFHLEKPHLGMEVTVPFLLEDWTFLKPQAFFLIFLPPVLLLLPTLSDLSWPQKSLMFLTRFGLFFIVMIALARPATLSEKRKLSVLYLVDISSSMGQEQIREAELTVHRLFQEAPKDAHLQLITFDRRPELRPTLSRSMIPPLRPGPPVEESQVGSALRYAMSLVPPGNDARMVLVSDGLETAGNALELAAELRRAQIPLFHHFPLAPARPEVFIAEFSMPPKVIIREPFELTAVVISNVSVKANFQLYQGSSPEEMLRNDLEFGKSVELVPGENVLKFKAQVNDQGIQAFRLDMDLADKTQDSITKNNQSWAVLMAKDKPRILYVEGDAARGRFFYQALRAANLEVEMRPAAGFPGSVMQMKHYTCIIQSDVPATYLSTGKMMALHEYVQGGGCYIMVGGENSFGNGGYYQTPIERLLPVRFDLEKNKRQPTVAMVMVIDRSGSMSGMKIRLAREAAIATVGLLGARDLVGVVAFDHRAQVAVELTPAANRSRIEQLISRIESDGGTEIVPALELGNEMLCDARAKVKHMILLSDGQAGRDRLEEVLQAAASCGITISVVGIGSDVDRGMLELIKERSQGRSYYTVDPNDLPRIFTKEASQVARPPLVDEPISVKIMKPATFLRGIDIEKAPYLLGYVPTKIKPQADLILASDLFGDPILARWNVGLGKAIAFTSDIKPRWSRPWIEGWAQGFQKFWAALIRDSMRIQRTEEYTMSTSTLDRSVHVTVDAVGDNAGWRNQLESFLEVQPFGGRTMQKPVLRQTAPGRYETKFNLPDHGAFLLSSKHYCNPQLAAAAGITCPGPDCPCDNRMLLGESYASVSFAYPRELKLVQPPGEMCVKNPHTCRGLMLLQQLSEQTGGLSLSEEGRNKLYAPGTRVEPVYTERWPVVLWPFFILFILDLLLRRVRIFGFARELKVD